MDPEGRKDGEELGGVKGGETIIKTYCMENIIYFSIKRGKREKSHNCDCVPYVQHGQDVCEVKGRLRRQEDRASRPREESTWWERYVLSVRKEKIIKHREA